LGDPVFQYHGWTSPLYQSAQREYEERIVMTVLDRFSLQGKVAVVTGGNRGIGLGIARAFAEAGGAVAVAARDAERNARAVAALRETGAPVVAVATDVRSRDSLAEMERAVTEALGPIDILVNDAGVGFHAEALTVSDAEWEQVMDVNVVGMWKACQVVGAGMAERRSGSIINIGSISGLIINRPQWHSPYGISKAAVHHLTRSLAAEWAPYDIRVNAIAPGYVKTEIADIDLPQYRHYWVDEVPMQRYSSPEEIAPTALYLASDASTFTTGSIIVVDGGYTLW
jgi:NAD(P)-dependent dehydrogenase (short-subunit alcohol dehydrogenase family)